MVPLGEIELTCSYVDPAVHHLFTNYDHETKLIWPNLTQKESLLSNNNVNKFRHPDAVLRILDQRVYGPSRDFGEIKTKERTDEKSEKTIDIQNKRTTLDSPTFRSYINAKKFQT
jgi:hypothetical protein